MRLLFTILTFIWISSSLGAQGFPPYFKEFFLGNSLSQVQETLKTHQSYLKEESAKPFVLDIPLFLYLSPLKEQGVALDLEKQRIYLDETHFFDFSENPSETPAYQFYYKDSFYYLSFKEILSYETVYPGRINPNLSYLKFKFFKNRLYSIEYEATLKNYEISRFRQNYLENFGQRLDEEENTFFTEKGMYVVKIDLPRNRVKVIQMSLPLYRQMEGELEIQISNLLNTLVGEIQTRLNRSLDLKNLLYQERKKILKEKIRKTYRWVDEL